MQPLDVGVFSPYAGAYKREVDEANRNGITGIDKHVFLELLRRARTKSFSPGNIRSSFRAAGLVPYNPAIVLEKLPNHEIRLKTLPATATTLAAIVTPINVLQVISILEALTGLLIAKKNVITKISNTLIKSFA